MGVLQAPVRYRATTTPTRAGVYKPPYIIINELQAITPGDAAPTVWVADNAGLQLGLGTPIYPGTSLTWTQDGELWVVADAPTDIIVSYDVEDWQPDPAAVAAAVLNAGVLVIDNPVTLMTASVVGPGLTTPIDIGRFQSLNISIILDVSSGADNSINILFGDGGVTTYRTTLNFRNVGQIWTAAIPCYGDSVRFELPEDSDFNIFMSGSHRSIQTVRQRIDETAGDQVPTDLHWGNHPNIAAAGGAFSVDLPPWHGILAIDARLNVTAAPVAGTFISVSKLIRPTFANTTIISWSDWVVAGTQVYSLQKQIVSNGDAMRVGFLNSNAVIANVVLRVTPASGALA